MRSFSSKTFIYVKFPVHISLRIPSSLTLPKIYYRSMAGPYSPTRYDLNLRHKNPVRQLTIHCIIARELLGLYWALDCSNISLHLELHIIED